MNRLAALLTVALMGLSLASAGCENKEAKQLKDLQQQYNDLQVKNQELQKNLADCQTQKADLEQQLQTAETRLSAATNEIVRLKGTPPPRPPTPPAPEKKPPLPPGWEATPGGGVKKTLAGDILFPPGKATLSSAGEAELRHVAATIKSAYSASVVRVFGYTDGDPVVKSAKLWQDNLDLSANRAMAVTRFLERQGIDGSRIETIAMGPTHPVAANTTAAGKAKNRRVEIVVVTAH